MKIHQENEYTGIFKNKNVILFKWKDWMIGC